MTQTTRSRLPACVPALLLAMASYGAGAADDARSGSEPGVWQAHKLDFNFMGFTSTYSCDGLGDTLQVLLKTTGVNQGAKVNPLCAMGPGRPDKLASATLKFESLQPQGAAPGGGIGAAPAVNGVWRHVEINSRQPRELKSGDCELVEQFADKILPLFATRNVERRITCIPHQDSGNSYSLNFEVFAPAAVPKTAQSMPARQ